MSETWSNNISLMITQVATWLDEVLSSVSTKLEHAATQFPEFITDRIAALHVCPLYTCAQLESGSLYWW